jgi:hypothetical protein
LTFDLPAVLVIIFSLLLPCPERLFASTTIAGERLLNVTATVTRIVFLAE